MQWFKASQGVIADRTREHLTVTDVGIVRFRRAVLEGAKALREESKEPEAPHKRESYCLRSGSCVAPDSTAFEAVMRQRFGSTVGRVLA
jgi:phthalate 4,5-dioxygenase oxygenase subunit